MISKGDYIVIHELYEKGYSIRKIAKMLKIDRKTITRRLKQNNYQIINRIIKRESKLESFKKFIVEFINKSNKRIPSSVILDEIKNQGFTGSRSILQDFLRDEYKKKLEIKDPIVRFETEPGYQAQVDWTTIRAGKKPIYGFVMTLGYSRKSFVYFTNNMEDDTLVLCHEKAFLFFSGATKTILYDNMKAVVIERNCYGTGLHKFNAILNDLSKKYGFIIRLCRPYRAKTKGKVERFNSYLKGNFYRPLLIKLHDAKLEITHQILNDHIFAWLDKANDRIHGTTNKKPNELFAEEVSHLTPYIASIEKEDNIRQAKHLPKVIIQRPNLAQYDQLLMGATA